MLRAFRSASPRVHPSAYVDQSAQIIGDVEIGEASSIWMNAVVRGDVHWIRIGARSNIQDGSVVHVMRGTHPTTIGDEVTVGHGVVLHGCRVWDRCLIGMGAIVLNGADIGSESIVAAGSIVVEGTVVPPGSLVMGSPARVRRGLSEEERAGIRQYADRYVEYRTHYHAEMLPS
jgi:carbonic anhydrase/acetyltransferase-like protein (isoleucine patch superfamily)